MDFELLIGIFPQVLLDGLVLGFMYALIALGYTMVYGVLEFINFAHSEIFIVGAFVGVEVLLTLKALGSSTCSRRSSCCSWCSLLGMLASGLARRRRSSAWPTGRCARAPRSSRSSPPSACRSSSRTLIRLFESIWRNSFNLVYPTMDALNLRFELTADHRRLGQVAGGHRRLAAHAVGRSTSS